VTGAPYRYAARTAGGERVTGSMHARSTEHVVAALHARALVVTGVTPDTGLRHALWRTFNLGSPSRRAMLAFYRSFATLIRAGVPMRRALEVTIDRAADGVLRESLRSIAADVEHGTALSDAMGRRPKAFADLYVAMVRAGERAGILDAVLDRLAVLLERDAELRKRLRAALAYPAIVVTAAFGLVLFLMARIVPMFAQMFEAFHVQLPATTRLLLVAGATFAQPNTWFAVTGILAAALSAATFIVRTERGALGFDRLRLRLPLLGPIVSKTITARISRMLATLLRSGIDLVTALDVVRPVAGSPVYAEALRAVEVAVRAGESLMTPLESARLFDPLAIALVGVGDETGMLDEMLLTIATYFEADVEAAIATLGAVIEPVLIVGLGLVVGFIVFSVFIPLYTLIGSVSQ
jgi:type IV pilus assembly protein PilC